MSKYVSKLSLYQQVQKAGIPTDHHESDLYVLDTPETRKILTKHLTHEANARSFMSNGQRWLDIPFAYDPFWKAKHSNQAGGMTTFKTIADVRAANKKIGHHWFDRGAMRFFHTKIESGLLGGRYFITSEYNESPSMKRYAIREVRPNGDVGTVGSLMDYAHKSDAKDMVERLLVESGFTRGGRRQESIKPARPPKVQMGDLLKTHDGLGHVVEVRPYDAYSDMYRFRVKYENGQLSHWLGDNTRGNFKKISQGTSNQARGSVTRGRSLAKKLRRRADGTYKPQGAKAKPTPRTCRCGAYPFPHARGGGHCPR